MTKSFIFIFILIVSLSAKSQNDTIAKFYYSIPILQAKEYKKGVYRTFEEFKNNSPSITSDFKITYEKIRIKNESGKYKKIKGKYFGACTGKKVYIKSCYYGRVTPLLTIGPYCYLICDEYDPQGGVYRSKKNFLFRSRKVLDIKTGKQIYIDSCKDASEIIGIYSKEIQIKLHKYYNYSSETGYVQLDDNVIIFFEELNNLLINANE
ncbi:MAG: hypothetical protein A2W91_13080 [Bacteroidetes bacterium GWF2_38_335]|nr:MAG: hypothetical protein A2W91_13080 [Bacteroidetes bacterium GWF2_38_335]OFY77189.1 MAG: hypothetical protein A2281_14745 [Bacteroidetes bacterium RIFOXYA12_FULL_38_20]HBS85811.1 hypothetical protein [Bacteroidales bacterium]